MTGSKRFSRRSFLTTVAAATGSVLLPRALTAGPLEDPDTWQREGKPEKVQWKARPFPMDQVRLEEEPSKTAIEAEKQTRCRQRTLKARRR
jgi:hypothetical protein